MICERTTQFHIRSYAAFQGAVAIVDGQDIGVLRTPCYFGGSRAWFECPWCYRRCAILYKIKFALKCRKCAHLRYALERLSPSDRRLYKALKIRTQLGQKSGGTLAPYPLKPDHMNDKTYWDLVRECQSLEEVLAKEMQLCLTRIRRRI